MLLPYNRITPTSAGQSPPKNLTTLSTSHSLAPSSTTSCPAPGINPESPLTTPSRQALTHRPINPSLSTVPGTNSSSPAGKIDNGFSTRPNVAASWASDRSDEKQSSSPLQNNHIISHRTYPKTLLGGVGGETHATSASSHQRYAETSTSAKTTGNSSHGIESPPSPSTIIWRATLRLSVRVSGAMMREANSRSETGEVRM